MDRRGTQYHFVVGLHHIGTFKNKDIESTELEVALKISLHTWKFINVVVKF